MKIVNDWLNKRRAKKEEGMRRINDNLREAGYLCPDDELHEYGVVTDWINDVRYMTCKNCGKTVPAMAKLNPPIFINPK